MFWNLILNETNELQLYIFKVYKVNDTRHNRSSNNVYAWNWLDGETSYWTHFNLEKFHVLR